MKKQIRRGVFETNSSSVHSITMCSQNEYSKWERGEVLKDRYSSVFKTRDEIVEELKNEKKYKSDELEYQDVDWSNKEIVDKLIKDNEYVTEEEFWDNVDYETFNDTYITTKGETVVAFGYYGADY